MDKLPSGVRCCAIALVLLAGALAYAQSRNSTAATPATAAARPVATPGPIAGLRPGASFKDCAACPEMVVIPAGSFTMGSPASEPGHFGNEGPQHQVTIGYQLAMGKYEVTFDEWAACLRESACRHDPGDSTWGRARRPVIEVSWHDAQQYVQWLTRSTGKRYRLPSEAEWEYAARAGTTTAFAFGNSINPAQANFDARESYAGSVTGIANGKTVTVGRYRPNGYGLYDMHGNVWEWVEDCWNGNHNKAPADGSARASGECGRRVVRGGSWINDPGWLRSADRGRFITSIRSGSVGFRVVRAD